MSRDRDSYAVEVGLRLQIARRAAGLSQADLALALDIDAMRLSNWELGKYHLPAKFAFKIFQATGINADWLYLGNPRHLPADIYAKVIAERRAFPEPPQPPIKPNPRRKRSPK